jgi:hypothetical protein
MAVRTSYGFRRPRTHSVNRVGSYAAVALVAERVDGRHVQQAGVLGTVRSVASHTPLGLDGDVFIDERPARLGVALGADQVLVGRGLQVVSSEGAVHVVAIAARDQAFVHLVVERHIERRLSVGVALEAELRLRSLQQIFFFLALVNAVAADTADVRLGVGRAVKVRVRSRVTGQALSVNLFGRVLRGIEYLGYVAAASNMLRSGTMAAFATLLRRATFLIKRGLPVRRLFPSTVNLVVTGLAGVGSNIFGRFRRRSTVHNYAGGWSGLIRSLRASSLSRSKRDEDKRRQNRECKNSKCPIAC